MAQNGKSRFEEHHQKAWPTREASARGKLLPAYGNALKLLAATIAAASITACSTVNIEEMEQLDGAQAREALAGNSLTYRAEFGRWAEYYGESDLSGAGKAWGDWGKEQAVSVTTIGESGEVCTVYEGEYKWSKPDLNFCYVLYRDAEGEYVIKSTRDDYKPERVGGTNPVQLAAGDKYNLMN